MQFYRIRGEVLANAGEENVKEKSTRNEIAYKIAVKTLEFNGGSRERWCFVSDMESRYVTLGLIAVCRVDPIELAEKYVAAIGIDARMDASEEITLNNLQNLLRTADRCSYIEDDDEILEQFGLDKLSGGFGRNLEFGENLINCKAQKEDLFGYAKKLFTNETLLPELERIYAGKKTVPVMGHPVHYIVESDDRDVRREIYKILLDALHANARLDNCRYSFLDFRPGENYSRMSYEALYKISEGGAVVVRYLAESDSEDGSNASAEVAVIENVCDMAKRYRNKVLTVLCFPRECKRVKARFYENLGSMSFVELREDFIIGASAKLFLADLAREHHVHADKKLFAEIKEDRSYLANELHPIFDRWYNEKLKRTVYPQYKDIAAAGKEIVKAKPQGTAYDELLEMIGLSEAKQVIKKALNYYKMQKLYEERGVKKDNPAMHMIFSGNPGTAKTTVARLFARIMRENGLLSRGQLVEVGRCDLVGKYVGWTATIVKDRFKAASGGVLFIDEAYSLVDDRDGSYGDEAINTIVQEMENHRTDMVVIFAGYPDKMEEFLQKNPGLRSRIAFHVPFADYDSAELCRIADMLSKKNGMRIDGEALKKMELAFEIARGESDFGNGRYVRNMFEQARMNQASRLMEKEFDSVTAEEITTITADDIILPEIKKPLKRRIGFC